MNETLSCEPKNKSVDIEPDVKRQKLDRDIKNPQLSLTENHRKCDKLPPTDTVKTANNYFGIDSEDSSSEDDYIKQNESKPAVPESTFWAGNCEDDWHEPDNIWEQNRSEETREDTIQKDEYPNGTLQRALPSTNHVQNVRRYTSKNTKSITQEYVNEDKTQTGYSTRTFKNPFFVHYKIAPLLNAPKSHLTYPKLKQRETYAGKHTVNRIKWSSPSYSHLLAVATSDKAINILHCFDNNINTVRTIENHTKAVKDVSWSKCGKSLLSCGYDKTACITDIETGTATSHCDHMHFVTATQFHPIDHNYFVTGCKEELLCWDKRNTTRAARLFKYKDSFGQVQDLTFNRNGTEIFSCNDSVSRDSSDRNIMAWDYRKGVVVSNQIYQERFTCTRLKIHPTNDEFYAQSQGGYIALFSSARPYKMNKYKRYEGHTVAGYNVGFDLSPDGTFIVSGSANGKIPVYDAYRAKCVHHVAMGDNRVCVDVAWHPVLPGTIAAATWNGEIVICQ